MIRLIKRSFRFFSVTTFVLLTLTIAVIGLGVADQPFFSFIYIPGNTIADRYDASVPVAWFHLAQHLAKETPGYSPPVVSRVFGYMGVTLYEAIVPGMPGYQSLIGQLNGLQSIESTRPGSLRHWPTVANAAMAEITRNLFPTASPENQKAINALEAQFDAAFHAEIRADVFAQSQAHGRLVARRIYEWAQDDGGNQAYLRKNNGRYEPPSTMGSWEPTPPQFDEALLPNWRSNRPFILTSSNQCSAGPPPRYSTAANSENYFEAMEVYKTVKNLNDEQRAIALFWADDPIVTSTISGHLISITSQVIQEQNVSLSMAALVYSKVGIALSDTFISGWEAKYTYTRMRPLTYIQQVIDPNWNAPELTDPVRTPPTPAYISEHAATASAVMTILSDLFGKKYKLSDRSHMDRGFAPRNYASFMAAAEEAALARFYGGVHYHSDIDEGVRQGSCIGQKVNQLIYLR